MDLASVLLGAAGIFLGANALANGAKRLSDGLGPTSGNRPGWGSSRVPVTFVPRSATLKKPPVEKHISTKQTVAGPMASSLYQARNLNDRLSIILAKAVEGKSDPRVIAWARKQVAQRRPDGSFLIREKDGMAELNQIYKGLRKDIFYVSDVHGIDTYAKPRHTLAMGAGDCDEYTSTGCAAVMAIGKPCRAVVVETKTSLSGADHIYFEAYANGRWVPMDASVPAYAGWEVPDSMIKRKWIYEID